MEWTAHMMGVFCDSSFMCVCQLVGLFVSIFMPILHLCQLKVNVTIEGQISNNHKLDIMLCLLCKSYIYWKIIFNIGLNVHLNMGIFRTHVTLLLVSRQSHTLRSRFEIENLQYKVLYTVLNFENLTMFCPWFLFKFSYNHY